MPITINMPRRLADRIEAERLRQRIPGVSIALFDGRRVLFHGGFGETKIGGAPVTAPDTVFRAASLTKLLTATLFLQQVEAGSFSLTKALPSKIGTESTLVPPKTTARQLLTHSSGLPVWTNGLTVNFPCANLTFPQVLWNLKRVAWPAQPIIYSNAGYVLLGHLLALKLGTPYEDLIQDLFNALLMKKSQVAIVPTIGPLATPYADLGLGGGFGPVTQMCTYLTPAAGLATTVIDLSKFGRMILNLGTLGGNTILTQGMVMNMLRPLVTNHPELEDGYGLGFYVSSWRGHRMAQHNGQLYGTAARLALLPDEGVGVAVLANANNQDFVYRVVAWALDAWGQVRPEPLIGGASGLDPGVTSAELFMFARAVEGEYKQFDHPLGPGAPNSRVTHAGSGVFVIDTIGATPTTLYPDGRLGRFRVVHPSGNTARALIMHRGVFQLTAVGEEGTHFWAGPIHGKRL